MLPLPLEKVDDFAARLENTWWRSRSWSKRRDALILGACLLGCRATEALHIRLSNCSVSEGLVLIRSAKGGEPRTLPVGISWMGAVFAVRRRGFGGVGGPPACRDLAFVTFRGYEVSYEQIRRRCREWTLRCFGQAFSPHCLRHTAAVRMYRATGDVLAVQRLLGHRSLRWTVTYLATAEPATRAGLPDFVTSDGRHARLRIFRGDDNLEGLSHGKAS